jgi:hypothetical protein
MIILETNEMTCEHCDELNSMDFDNCYKCNASLHDYCRDDYYCFNCGESFTDKTARCNGCGNYVDEDLHDLEQAYLDSLENMAFMIPDPECGDYETIQEEVFRATIRSGFTIKTTTEYTIGKTKFKVISCFVGDKNIRDSILKIAENKALKTMNLK